MGDKGSKDKGRKEDRKGHAYSRGKTQTEAREEGSQQVIGCHCPITSSLAGMVKEPAIVRRFGFAKYVPRMGQFA